MHLQWHRRQGLGRFGIKGLSFSFLFIFFFFFFFIIFIIIIIINTGGIWFGGQVIFNITNCTFSSLVAGNLTSTTDPPKYGGAIYSQSNAPGLRYLINVVFVNNAVLGSKGV
jgi:hypothetical protein